MSIFINEAMKNITEKFLSLDQIKLEVEFAAMNSLGYNMIMEDWESAVIDCASRGGEYLQLANLIAVAGSKFDR